MNAAETQLPIACLPALIPELGYGVGKGTGLPQHFFFLPNYAGRCSFLWLLLSLPDKGQKTRQEGL